MTCDRQYMSDFFYLDIVWPRLFESNVVFLTALLRDWDNTYEITDIPWQVGDVVLRRLK